MSKYVNVKGTLVLRTNEGWHVKPAGSPDASLYFLPHDCVGTKLVSKKLGRLAIGDIIVGDGQYVEGVFRFTQLVKLHRVRPPKVLGIYTQPEIHVPWWKRILRFMKSKQVH